MSNDYLRSQQGKFEGYAESYRKEANEVFRELVQQLILVGTVLLSVSVFIFNIQDLSSRLSRFYGLILLFSWIFIAASLVFGITQYIVDYLFFYKWVNAKSKIVEDIYNGDIDENNIGERVEDAQRGIANTSPVWPVLLQMFTFCTGLVLLAIVMGHLLFSI
jgi:hypothetical protein